MSDNHAQLTEVKVGDVSGHFFVPSYQRGYRWGRHEVLALLDDIWASEGDYYLQPVVVRRRGDGSWELIDGQQRLTTLYLVLSFMEQAGLQSTGASWDLEYETRPDSADYLRNPDGDRRLENIDFFHVHQAYECIREWFDGQGPRRQYVANKFYEALFERVLLIWYVAPGDIEPTELFRRLNVGRIPLTDAELVKAHLLTQIGGGFGPDRAVQVAAQWDGIERDLRQPEVWSFVSGRAENDATNITLLLDTIAGGPTGRARPLFHTFDELRNRMGTPKEAQDVWEEVLDRHSLVIGWFEDRSLFHSVGFLVATGTNLGELLASASGSTRSDLDGLLIDRIRERLDVAASDLAELSYEDTSNRVRHVLLLVNVETVRHMLSSTERFSFNAYAAQSWSLEHIHAQNAEQLNRADQWTAWLKLHRGALPGLPDVPPALRETLEDRIDAALEHISQEAFRVLERELATVFAPAGDGDSALHTLPNLALLGRNENTALSNAFFEAKRRMILELDRAGAYIPPATRRVFLKYYTNADALQIHFWSSADQQAYLDEITRLLAPYVKPEENV